METKIDSGLKHQEHVTSSSNVAARRTVPLAVNADDIVLR